jgi:hypothetical protein
VIKSKLPKGEAIQYQSELVALRTQRQHAAAAIRAQRATRVLKLVQSLSEFGHSHHRGPDCWATYTKKTVLPVGRCDKVGCEQPATQRIAINCHGVVYECDVCVQHADRHGKWVDSL